MYLNQPVVFLLFIRRANLFIKRANQVYLNQPVGSGKAGTGKVGLKTDKEREVYLNQTTRAILADLVEQAREYGSEYVFK